jgi:hypothetical protein
MAFREVELDMSVEAIGSKSLVAFVARSYKRLPLVIDRPSSSSPQYADPGQHDARRFRDRIQLHDDIDWAVGRIRMKQQAAYWAFGSLSESEYSLVKK